MESPENEKELIPQVTAARRNAGRALAAVLTCALICVLLAVVTFEHWCFYRFTRRVSVTGWHHTILSAGLGCFCGTQIKVVDAIWDRISNWITDLECRTLESDFNNAKRLKATIVKLITSSCSMFFFAFVQPYMGCGGAGERCLVADQQQLQYQLSATFITRHMLFSGITAYASSWIPYRRLLRFWKGMRSDMPFFEQQLHMDTYTGTQLTNDFLDVLLPLGFILCFGMIFPLSALFLLVALLIRTRVDVWKLLNVYRRPFPTLAEGIGVFNDFLGIFGFLMVCCNLALVFIDFGGFMHLLPAFELAIATECQHGWLLELFVFLVVVLILLAAWSIVDQFMPKVAFFIRLERRRQDKQRSILFYHSAFRRVETKTVSASASMVMRRADFTNYNDESDKLAM